MRMESKPKGDWKFNDQEPPFIPKDGFKPFIPKGGWNPVFTAKDRSDYTDYYEYLLHIHGPIIAEMMSQMIIYKRKYHLKYSEEQEKKIADSFTRQQHKP